MKLTANGVDSAGKKLHHIRLDLISRTTEGSELWWVAREFEDGTTQPEGMFTSAESARAAADRLAATLGVQVAETHFDAAG